MPIPLIIRGTNAKGGRLMEQNTRCFHAAATEQWTCLVSGQERPMSPFDVEACLEQCWMLFPRRSVSRAMTTPFRTDVTVRGSLNAGLLPSAGRGKPGSGASSGSGGRGGAGAEAEPTSEAYLDRFAEDLNRKIDNDIEVLVDGLEQCVELSKVCRERSEGGEERLLTRIESRWAARTSSKLRRTRSRSS